MESSEYFRCDKCSKVFGTLGRYNQHLKTHTKPFQCSECVRGFALRSDLTRHVQARHRLGVAQHACAVAGCSFKASRKDNIRQNIQNSHPQLLVGLSKAKVGRRRARLHGSPPSSIALGVSLDIQNDLLSASTCTLMQASSDGNIGLVQVILQSGVDVSVQADDGSTALHCAAKADQIEMINFLISLGDLSNVRNNKGRTPLHEAILGRRSCAAKILMGRKVDITAAVLRATIETSQIEMFEEAWSHSGKHMSGKIGLELFEIAASSTQTTTMAALLSLPQITQQWVNNMGWSTLCWIISKGQVAILDCLLKSGKLDPYSKVGLLYLAIARGNSEILSLLLESDTIDPNPISYDEISSSLGVAASRGHIQVVEKLLQHPGIVIDGKAKRFREQKTSLHLACRQGHVEIIWLMLKAFDDRGLHVDSPDKSTLRLTPFQHAVYSGTTETVELLLLRKDIDVNRTFPSTKMSLWQVAAHHGHVKTLSVLLGDCRVDRGDARNSRRSLLYEAISGGHWCLADVLLDYEKVPLDTTRKDLNVLEELSRKHIDILGEFLVDTSLLPPQTDSLWHRAAREGNLSLAMVLLEHAQTHNSSTHPSVDVNRKDDTGRTPLHIAVKFGNPGIVELLLHHKQIGINITAGKGNSKRPQSALDVVEANRWGAYWYVHKEEHAYVVDLLRAHGAGTVSHDLADHANSLVSPPLAGGLEHEDHQPTEQSADLRLKGHQSWASIVGIQGNDIAPGETRTEDENIMDDSTLIDLNDPMEEGPDATFD